MVSYFIHDSVPVPRFLYVPVPCFIHDFVLVLCFILSYRYYIIFVLCTGTRWYLCSVLVSHFCTGKIDVICDFFFFILAVRKHSNVFIEFYLNKSCIRTSTGTLFFYDSVLVSQFFNVPVPCFIHNFVPVLFHFFVPVLYEFCALYRYWMIFVLRIGIALLYRENYLLIYIICNFFLLF